ncbi:MAG: GIY-YIG nuclease family protein [Saprospiraceae bacterium]|nr:GIY-YIG nuclease family protein [Saprospiraceae bacterium]
MFLVYILYSEKYNRYYIGQTEDLDQRMRSHNESSERTFTSKYRPWKVVMQMGFPDRRHAVRAERYIKRRKSKTYLEELITSVACREALRKRVMIHR